MKSYKQIIKPFFFIFSFAILLTIFQNCGSFESSNQAPVTSEAQRIHVVANVILNADGAGAAAGSASTSQEIMDIINGLPDFYGNNYADDRSVGAVEQQ